MSEWKEIFQFSRAETFALAILLLMILIGGGILLYENSTESLPPELFFQSAGAATTHSSSDMTLDDTLQRVIRQPDSVKAPATLGHREPQSPLMVNLNTAPAESLMMLPRLGPTLSQRIIELRQQLGRFDSLGQLVQVRGIGKKTLDKIRPYCTIGDATPADTTERDTVSTHK